MNIYLVVEGPIAEKKVYSDWIKYFNNDFIITKSLEEMGANSVYIISGGGYPNYFEVIESAAHDVYDNHIDRLAIAIDSEDMSYEDKRAELIEFVDNLGLRIDYRIIVQHFCIETWMLGNRIIINRKPSNPNIRRYRQIFDVLLSDPANLPPNPEEGLNRAQFAERYLRALLNDKYRNLTYSKRNADVLLHRTYYQRVLKRFTDTGHIASFNDFLTAFI